MWRRNARLTRGPRIEYPGAVYHVMCRGDQRERIFQTDADRRLFLATLAQACAQTGWRAHAYVLMPNHYHLLLETPEGNLVAGMRWFQSTYTRRYNGRHKLCGHLFQGRYKALIINGEEPAYFRVVSDYIHLNPVRAGMLNPAAPDLLAFRWSSYPAYAGRAPRPQWVQTDQVLHCHGWGDDDAGHRAYVLYMAGRVADEAAKDRAALNREWQALRRGWYLGDEGFRGQLLEKVGAVMSGRKRESYTGMAAKGHDERRAEQLLHRGLSVLGLSLAQVQGLPQNDLKKQGLAWLLRSATVVSGDWVRAKLSMGHRSNVSRAVRRIDEREVEAAKMRALLQPCKD